MSEKKELTVIALSDSESSPGNYVLILEEKETHKRIPIIIGIAEAQAIAVTMERIKPLRPMTHDLMKNTLVLLDATIKEVVIQSLIDGVFYASLLIEKMDGLTLMIDARASDAIALAIRFEVPIFTYQNVIDEAGVRPDTFTNPNKKNVLTEYTLAELEILLEKVIAQEDYQTAAKVARFNRKTEEELGIRN